jgi:hypothetical protein
VGPLRLLRPERALLHRPLPPLLLLAHHHTKPSPCERRRRRTSLPPTWFSRRAQTIDILRVTLLSRCYGIRPRQQDGQHSAVDPLLGQLPSHAVQAICQHHSVGRGEQMVGRGRQEDAEAGWL